MLIPLLGSLLGCTGGTDPKDSAATDADADTDADSDTDADADTGTGPSGNTVTGAATAYDGSSPGGLAVQICDIACYSSETEADGSFVFEGIPAGEYKIDAVGESLGEAYAHSRIPYTVVDGENALAWPLYVPVAGTAGTITSGTQAFGSVFWTVNASDLSLPLGYDTYDFTVGVIDLSTVPDYWGIGATFAVNFMPFDTGVDAPFDIAVSGQPDMAYEVYAVGSHGELEDLGPAASAGGTIVAQGIQPTKLTWLLFAPQ